MTSVINVTILFTLHQGEMIWVCLASCGADVSRETYGENRTYNQPFVNSSLSTLRLYIGLYRAPVLQRVPKTNRFTSRLSRGWLPTNLRMAIFLGWILDMGVRCRAKVWHLLVFERIKTIFHSAQLKLSRRSKSPRKQHGTLTIFRDLNRSSVQVCQLWALLRGNCRVVTRYVVDPCTSKPTELNFQLILSKSTLRNKERFLSEKINYEIPNLKVHRNFLLVRGSHYAFCWLVSYVLSTVGVFILAYRYLVCINGATFIQSSDFRFLQFCPIFSV